MALTYVYVRKWKSSCDMAPQIEFRKRDRERERAEMEHNSSGVKSSMYRIRCGKISVLYLALNVTTVDFEALECFKFPTECKLGNMNTEAQYPVIGIIWINPHDFFLLITFRSLTLPLTG